MITMVDTMAACQVERLTQMLYPMCVCVPLKVSVFVCLHACGHIS